MVAGERIGTIRKDGLTILIFGRSGVRIRREVPICKTC